MKPLGKTMKIARYRGEDEKVALQNLLVNYRDTPHPSTGVPPASMLFRDSMAGIFPRKAISEEMISNARESDRKQKYEYETTANHSKYKIYSTFQTICNYACSMQENAKTVITPSNMDRFTNRLVCYQRG